MNPDDEDKEEEFFTSATPVFQVSYSTDVSMLPFVCLSICLSVFLSVSLSFRLSGRQREALRTTPFQWNALSV